TGRPRSDTPPPPAAHHARGGAVLAAAVLVAPRLGAPCLRRDLRDGRAFEAARGEQPAAGVKQLLAALPAGHALAVVIASGRIGHASIIAVMPRSGHPAAPSSPVTHRAGR